MSYVRRERRRLTRFKALMVKTFMLLLAACLVSDTIFAQEETPEKSETKAAIEEPIAEEKMEEPAEGEETTAEAESAEEEPDLYNSVETVVQLQYTFDNAMLFICAVLVLFMQAGFAMVEAGFNQSKNVVNILKQERSRLVRGCVLDEVVRIRTGETGSETI